jgi:hypothetical protein
MVKLITGALFAFMINVLLPTGSAQAQAAYPCPYGGPSPGHRVVGQTQAGNGVGSVLLCVADGTEQSTPQ